MTADLFTDSPEVAALKAENKMLRQHLKNCVREIDAVRKPVQGAFQAIDELGVDCIQAELYLRDLEVGHDNQ